MKKIMFNDKYGLTDAVLKGRKTMTRRICKEYATRQPILSRDVESFRFYPEENIVEFLMKDGTIKVSVPPYKNNEVVAVAQAYKDIEEYNPESYEDVMLDQGTICEASHPYSHLMKSGGWDNKMFVRAELMPHQIRMTNIKVERLQDISDEDCMKEGIYRWKDMEDCHKSLNEFQRNRFGYHGVCNAFPTPRKAFANLIDKPGVGGKGTWERNPWVFVCSF